MIKDFFKYFISREFFLTLGGLGILGLLLYLLVFLVILPGYTRHGDSVLVPDVNKMTIEEAVKTLDKVGLRYEKKDSTFRMDYPSLSIVDQYPAPYSRVKPGRKIFLTINKSEPPLVKLPDLDNMNRYRARQTLENWKLSVGEVTVRPDFSTPGTVLDVTYQGKRIKTGTQLPQGARIDLIVSQGRLQRQVEIPNLIGLTYEDALTELRKLDLVIGSISYRTGESTEDDGRVIVQIPRASYGDSIQVGSDVALIIQGQETESLEIMEADTSDQENEN